MKRKNTLLMVFAVLGLISGLGNRSGALPGNSGAPNEDTCARGGCHAGMPNQGDATVALKFNEDETTFVPGSTNTVEISISGAMNESRNGFMVVALDGMANNVGQWMLTDETNTRLREGAGIFADRRYITHTRDGSSQSSWSIDWVAPEEAPDSVVFYLAYNDANANGMSSGDDIYTLATSIKNGTVTSVNNLDPSVVKLYPNPAVDFIRVESAQYQFDDYSVFDLTGRRVAAGIFNDDLIPVSQLDQGVYVLKLRGEEGQLSTKLMIN